MHRELGRDDTLFIHVTLLPYIGATERAEDQADPAQRQGAAQHRHPAGRDRRRSDYPGAGRAEGQDRAVLRRRPPRRGPAGDRRHDLRGAADARRSRPGRLRRRAAGARRGAAPTWPSGASSWSASRTAKRRVAIGVVGKYVELHDAYISVRESLHHAGWHHDRKREIEWIDSQQLERRGPRARRSTSCDGIVVPGGFGYRGVEGKIQAARFARERRCRTSACAWACRCMCIEFARHVLGVERRQQHRVRPVHPHPVIDLLPEQRDVAEKGGTMRLGVYPCQLRAGHARRPRPTASRSSSSATATASSSTTSTASSWQRPGCVFSGLSPDGRLVEIAELRGSPVDAGHAVPPGVQVAAEPAASAVPRLHGGGGGAQSASGEQRGTRLTSAWVTAGQATAVGSTEQGTWSRQGSSG